MQKVTILLLSLFVQVTVSALPALSQSDESQINQSTPPQIDPSRIQQLEQNANQAYRLGKPEESLLYYSQLLELQPNNYTYQVRIAITLLNSGPEFLDQAYDAFNKAYQLNPNIQDLSIIARIDDALERKSKAKEAYQAILNADPENAEALLALKRLNSSAPPPPLAETLTTIKNRSLEEYLAALAENSTEINGLNRQLQIIRSTDNQRFFPYLNLGYSASQNNGSSLDPVAPIFSPGPLEPVFEKRLSEGDGSGFSVNLGWNLGNIFFSENKIREQSVANQIQDAKERLKLETTRLYIARQSMLNDFQNLAWQSVLNPSENKDLRIQQQDRYLQLFYLTEQINRLTSLY